MKRNSGGGHAVAEHATTYWMLGSIVAGFIAPGNGLVDASLAISVPLHMHLGLEQVITDYVHGKGAFVLAKSTLRVLTVGTIAALIYFNISDVGITEAIRELWVVSKRA